MQLICTVQDRSLGEYAARLKRLGIDGRVTLATTLNAAGEDVRLLTVAAEAKQTGLDPKTIGRAQKPINATASTMSFKIRSDGGNIRLKFFGAQESEVGVLAHPLGREQVFAHAFMKGGRFPDRVTVTKLNGQVFQRTGAGRTPIQAVRSGVTIPSEMVTGNTAAAFSHGVATIVATTIVTKLGALALP